MFVAGPSAWVALCALRVCASLTIAQGNLSPFECEMLLDVGPWGLIGVLSGLDGRSEASVARGGDASSFQEQQVTVGSARRPHSSTTLPLRFIVEPQVVYSALAGSLLLPGRFSKLGPGLGPRHHESSSSPLAPSRALLQVGSG